MDATSITLLAEWNVLDAMPQETHTRETKILLIQFLVGNSKLNVITVLHLNLAQSFITGGFSLFTAGIAAE